jgi:MYXO-CTERM domain-containing protein
VAAAVACLTGTVGRAANVPIALTPGSFNYNTIVTAGTPGSSATIVGGTPASVDTENGLTFWGSSYNTSGALPAAGTPFTSVGNAATQFQFASFTGNNTMFINADQKYSGASSPPYWAPPYGQTGSVALKTPAAYTSLAVLYSASGQNYYSQVPVIDYTLSFADGTTYNNSGAAGFQGYGWHDNSGIVATSGERVSLGTGNTSTSNSWYLHEADITIPAADVNEVLTGISFYDSGSGYYNSPNSATSFPNSLAVYAVSGSATPTVPEPASGGFIAAAVAAAALRQRRRTDDIRRGNRPV